jgi:hypothetical protein
LFDEEVEMQMRRSLISVSAFIVGSMVAAVITASQAHAPSLDNLALQKRDVSKMDWVLLDARVTALESTQIPEASQFVTPLDFAYDQTSKKIVARGFVRPEWLSKANAQQIRKVFIMRAIDFCGVAVAGALMKDGAAAGFAWQKNCSVRFVSWDVDSSNGLSSKDVAFFDNGQLTLE